MTQCYALGSLTLYRLCHASTRRVISSLDMTFASTTSTPGGEYHTITIQAKITHWPLCKTWTLN